MYCEFANDEQFHLIRNKFQLIYLIKIKKEKQNNKKAVELKALIVYITIFECVKGELLLK